MKKLMLLGGIRYLLPVIEAAHKMGVYVIMADRLCLRDKMILPEL